MLLTIVPRQAVAGRLLIGGTSTEAEGATALICPTLNVIDEEQVLSSVTLTELDPSQNTPKKIPVVLKVFPSVYK